MLKWIGVSSWRRLLVAHVFGWLHFCCALTWMLYAFTIGPLPAAKTGVLQWLDPPLRVIQFPLNTVELPDQVFFLLTPLVGFMIGFTISAPRARSRLGTLVFSLLVLAVATEMTCAFVMILDDPGLVGADPPHIWRGLTWGWLLPLPWTLVLAIYLWLRDH